MESHQQTLRVRGLPPKADEEDLRQWFGDRIKKSLGKKIIQHIGPLCFDANTSTVSTTITFSSNNTAQKALGLGRQERAWGKSHWVELDHEFRDITTLYKKDNPRTGKPDVDIIALHGLAGHAWNTFTKSEPLDQASGYTQEINWLRDLLPDLLHNFDPDIHYRIMTFGYDAEVWMSKSVADIQTYVRNLLNYLDVERKDDPERPILFIGHSLGGLVIKDAIASWADQAIMKTYPKYDHQPAEKLNFPVVGCILFGVPNRGTTVADSLDGYLRLLGSVFSINQSNVTDLRAKSYHLMDISSRFREVQKEYDIPVLSFFETEKWSKTVGLIVDQESAVFEYKDMPDPFGCQKNHKEMVKFSHKSEHGLQPASDFLGHQANKAVVERQAKEQATSKKHLRRTYTGPKANEEDKLAILKNSDTVFLIDDSPSMKKKWDLLIAILGEATDKATFYDTDGVDIYLMNNSNMNKTNVRSLTAASEILRKVHPVGSTPIYSWLCRILDYFLDAYDKDGKHPNFKNFNLILFTDGEPDEEDESESEISDEEDAERHDGAYRLIRKKIVDTARHLDRTKARKDQLGIQFCQLGNNEDATRFFDYLDNEIKKGKKLKRDMVDTIKCESFSDITPDFIQKLLIGALSSREDKKILPVRSLIPPPSVARSTTYPRLAHSSSSASNSSQAHPRLSASNRSLTGDTMVNSHHHPTLEPLLEAQIANGNSTQQPEGESHGQHWNKKPANDRHSKSDPAAYQIPSTAVDEDSQPKTGHISRSTTFGSIRKNVFANIK